MSARRAANDQRGFMLAEVLVAMAIMLVISAAVLGVFQISNTLAIRNGTVNDSQQQARAAIDELARDLRNTASDPSVAQSPFERATAYDIVVRTVDPTTNGTIQNPYSIRRVRYCLDGDTSGKGRLWQETQALASATTSTLPADTTCPGGTSAGWTSSTVLVDHVSNHLAGRADTPLFNFNPSAPADPSQIKAVRPQLSVNTDRRTFSGDIPLGSGVFLRNQNLPPVSDAAGAPFSVTLVGHLHVTLTATTYEDPQGGPLTYTWYMDGPSTKIGSGLTLDYLVPSAGQHSFYVVVTNTNLTATTAPAQTLNVT